jgi:hypothetical protein
VDRIRADSAKLAAFFIFVNLKGPLSKMVAKYRYICENKGLQISSLSSIIHLSYLFLKGLINEV